MNVINAGNRFVPAKPQSELNGQMGLTVQDIAESLGVDVGHIRRNLAARGMLERLKVLNLKIIPFGNLNSNGVEYTDYVLDLGAAKFVIARYNNVVGDAYLSYLIKMESDAVQSGQTFGHVDPTKIAEMMSKPDFIIKLATNWKLAEERANAETKLRIVKEAEVMVLTNELSECTITSDQRKAIDAAIAYKRKEYQVRVTCTGHIINMLKAQFNIPKTHVFYMLPRVDFDQAISFIQDLKLPGWLTSQYGRRRSKK